MSDIRTNTLECGCEFITERIEGVRSAAVCVLLPIGNAFDDAGAPGRAAMLAQLLTRGAGDLDSRAQADALERCGVGRSVQNGPVFVSLRFTLLGERLAEAAPLIADHLLRPRFDPADVEPCRQLCLHAIASLEDEPAHRAELSAAARHFPSPFERSGYGTPEGVAAVSRDVAHEAWARHALPGGSAIAIAGAIGHDEARALFEPLLRGWEGEAPPLPPLGEAPRGYEHTLEERNQVQIVVMHDAPREAEEGSAPARVLNAVLSAGMSARLFTEVREKRGLCYSVHSSYSAARLFGSVTATVGTSPERAQESLDVLTAELARIETPEGRVTEDEFERAVNRMKSGLVFGGESTSARAAALATDWYRIGRPRSLAELAARIDAVTLEGLREYAARRDRGRVTVQTLGSRELTPPAGWC